jgi:hypothetical protein
MKIKQRSPSKKKSQPKKKSNKKIVTSQSIVATRSMGKVPRNGPQRVPDSLVESICAITDPFCQAAKGTKWPDGLGEATLPAQIRGHFTYAVATNGGCLAFISPILSYGVLNSTWGGTSYSLNATYATTPGYQAISSYAGQYRVVTAGIIIRNVCAALTTSGYLIVTRLAQMPPISSSINAGNVYGVECSTHPICAGMEVPVTFRPLGSAARAFVNASVNTGLPDSNFDVISIEVVGGPTTGTPPVIDVEFVYNIEFTLSEPNIGLQQFVATVAPESPLSVKVANQVSATLSSLAHTSVEAVAKYTVNAVGRKLKNYLFGPTVGTAMMLADSIREVD